MITVSANCQNKGGRNVVEYKDKSRPCHPAPIHLTFLLNVEEKSHMNTVFGLIHQPVGIIPTNYTKKHSTLENSNVYNVQNKMDICHLLQIHFYTSGFLFLI